MKSKTVQPVLILHDLRSAENVGSLFRTADAVGVTRLYLSSITPSPVDRFGRPQSKVTKSALGAELSVPWEQYDSILDLFKKLRSEHYQIIAIEQSEQSIDYKNLQITTPVAFVLGNEVDGIPQKILTECDVVVEIPMRGTKESLNVSVAGGVVLFRILDL